jgi:putative ABC transport system permease protein
VKLADVLVMRATVPTPAFSAGIERTRALGRTIFCPFDSLGGMKIIGVVGNVRQRGPEREPMPECYMPYGQHGFNGPALSLVVRTTGDPNALTQTLRSVAHEANPEAPMKFTTMEAMLAENVAAPRFRTVLFAVFGALAVCLAIAGIYGVVVYAGRRPRRRCAVSPRAGTVARRHRPGLGIRRFHCGHTIAEIDAIPSSAQ